MSVLPFAKRTDAPEDFDLNGWNVFRSGAGDWCVCDKDADGVYLEDAYFDYRRDAVRFANRRPPLSKMVTEVVRINQFAVRQ